MGRGRGHKQILHPTLQTTAHHSFNTYGHLIIDLLTFSNMHTRLPIVFMEPELIVILGLSQLLMRINPSISKFYTENTYNNNDISDIQSSYVTRNNISNIQSPYVTRLCSGSLESNKIIHIRSLLAEGQYTGGSDGDNFTVLPISYLKEILIDSIHQLLVIKRLT